MSNLKINYSRDHNCYNLTVNAILSRSIDKTNLIWNQAGMISFFNDEAFEFTPYYLRPKDHLLYTANIRLIDIECNDFYYFCKNLKNVLNDGNTILVNLDIYYLPYSLYYKKKHSNHTVEVVSLNNDYFTVYDHFYKYVGEINKSILEEAIYNLNNKISDYNFTFTWFDTSNININKNIEWSKDIIKRNISVIKGDATFPILEKSNFTREIGLKAFDKFKDHINTEVFKLKKHNTQTYRGIFKFSNSRHNYSEFLKSLEQEIKGVSSLIQGYQEISHDAKICANLLLKIATSKQHERYKDSMNNKLELIRKKEEEMIQLSDDIYSFRSKE